MSYSLMHGPTLRGAAPYTFFLPHPLLVDAIRVGDLVKVGFEYDPPGEKYDGERMWVEVDRIDDHYKGRLVNEPDEPKPALKYGDEVSFARENILDVLLVDQSKLPAIEADSKRYPQLPEEREYWDRCLVDACVLFEGTPVEYLYREEPEVTANDQHPDSGWRIRGKQGVDTDKDMEEREVEYVALGAVLNRDDSWLHLIDAPVGCRFLRDPNTGEYASAP